MVKEGSLSIKRVPSTQLGLKQRRDILKSELQQQLLCRRRRSPYKIDSRLYHGYLRSCPPSSGAGRFIGPRSGNRIAKPVRIRVGSWNVGTLTEKRYELVETLRKRKVDILCVQETRWKGRGAVKTNGYKLWFSGSRVARNGVGIIIGPPYNVNVVDVDRRSDRIMSVRLVIQEVTYTVISAYAPHAGLGEAEKRHFWESLDEVVRMCPQEHRLLIGGDLNGHIGTDFEGYAGAHGGFGFGIRNEEGISILEFAVAHDLAVANSFFKKTDAQLATFHSGGHSTQIDYLLLRKGDVRTCGDCKVLTDVTCSSQHRLLVMDLALRRRVTKSVRPIQPKILWKKLIGEKAVTFKTSVVERIDASVEMTPNDDADQMWIFLASTIREVAKEALGVAVGTSRGHKTDRESCGLVMRVEERYKEAKREAKKAVARAKEKAYEDLYRKLDSKEGANDIYRIAKARERRRRDIDNIRFIKNEAGQTLVKEDEIRKRWEEYFSSLFIGGRPEHHEDLQEADIEQFQINRDCEEINHEEVRLALRKMGRNKAVGPDQIPIEAWWCLGDDGIRWLTCLFNKMFRSSKMPMEWRLSETIPIYKNKGDAQICESKEELNRRLEQWRVALESNGLQISRQKTEYLRCDFDRNDDAQEDGVNICIGDQILHPQTSFRYLGSVLHKSGRIDEDVSHRIKVGWLNWRSATGAQERRMEVAEMRMLRWTCGKTMLDMIPNSVFRENLEPRSISDKLREGRLRWFGHVRRRPLTAPVRRVEALTIDGVRRRGRPTRF
ncbi:uncharacterized protein [Rutidosis leptorrhynchoides]|uniref:uncharacterized protein n=1 Tax=Rutidosis leptorrhynchoides TaxID=125765 RepID=UPI003A995FE9